MAEEVEKLKIGASRELLKGAYANYVRVGHSANEFVWDFFNLLPPEGALTSRVIMSPTLAKVILSTLEKNTSLYEHTFGEIKPTKERKYEIGFQPTD